MAALFLIVFLIVIFGCPILGPILVCPILVWLSYSCYLAVLFLVLSPGRYKKDRRCADPLFFLNAGFSSEGGPYMPPDSTIIATEARKKERLVKKSLLRASVSR